MLKDAFFIAFLTQKLAPSSVLNAIIFCIDEQCNLIFKTALFTNCKTYIIFLIQVGPTFYSSLSFSFPFLPYFTISLLSLSPAARPLCLPLRQNLGRSIKPSQFLFLLLFTQCSLSLSALSFSFLSHFFLLSSLSVLHRCGSPMIVLRRLWDANGCGLVIVVMDRGSDGCGLVAMMEVSSFSLYFFCSTWFFLGPIGLQSCEVDTK